MFSLYINIYRIISLIFFMLHLHSSFYLYLNIWQQNLYTKHRISCMKGASKFNPSTCPSAVKNRNRLSIYFPWQLLSIWHCHKHNTTIDRINVSLFIHVPIGAMHPSILIILYWHCNTKMIMCIVHPQKKKTKMHFVYLCVSIIIIYFRVSKLSA